MQLYSTAELARKQLLAAAIAATCVASTTASANELAHEWLSKQGSQLRRDTLSPQSTFRGYEVVPSGYLAYETTSTTFSGSDQSRETSEREQAIGELRRWQSLANNWDGEGAKAPNQKSLSDASSFICAMDSPLALPSPMLHSSGHAGLYWRENSLYADLEFLGDGRVAYYIENGRNRHKGVVEFDTVTIPAVFKTLIWS